jgi:hypothetical protein
MLRIASGLVVIVVAVVGSGCSSRSGRAAVRGTVNVNSQPLEAGDISFVPLSPDQGLSAGAPIVQGAYNIRADKGPLPGEYKVQIHAFRGTGKKTWDGMGDPTAPASQKRYVEEMEPYIPARYNDATELKATVVADKTNEFKFDLQIPAIQKSK